MLQCSIICSIEIFRCKKEQNMRPTPKSTKTATEKPDITETFLPMYTKSVERLAELQKKTLEITAQQNAEWLDTWKKMARFTPQPGLFMFDLAGQMFDRFVETQKGMLDMAVEQSQTAAGVAKDRGAALGKAAKGVTGMFQQMMEQSIAAQKKALDFFAEQQKMAYETTKKQFQFAGNPMAEAFQSGLDALIESQKAMLDVASKPLHTPVM